MKIEILGRHIEIDDVKVTEILDQELNKYKSSDIDKDEFVQRVLDYFEFTLEDIILSSVKTKVRNACRVIEDIANYIYSIQISPFKKSWMELRPDDIPISMIPISTKLFLEKLGLKHERDVELIKRKRKENEEKNIAHIKKIFS
jgi:hypothetical protein